MCIYRGERVGYRNTTLYYNLPNTSIYLFIEQNMNLIDKFKTTILHILIPLLTSVGYSIIVLMCVRDAEKRVESMRFFRRHHVFVANQLYPKTNTK